MPKKCVVKEIFISEWRIGDVHSVSSDKVVIVCKDAERDVIVSLLTQIGWRNHIQSIVTESNLICWYEKALRGKYAEQIGDELIIRLCGEIAEEFPSVESRWHYFI